MAGSEQVMRVYEDFGPTVVGNSLDTLTE